MKYFLLLLVVDNLTIAPLANAVPLRELIFQTIAKEHHGVLTQQEIHEARVYGAKCYHKHIEGTKLDKLYKASAQQTFPNDASKQNEWILECQIGYMMAAEASAWEPK